MSVPDRIGTLGAVQAAAKAISGGSHATLRVMPPFERAKFIRHLYGAGNLDTMQVVARMYEDYGPVVTEAEVCRATRRRGEVVHPYRARVTP